MESGRDGGRPSFLGRPIADGFDVRWAMVAPGRPRAFEEAEWEGALVVVERGRIELECVNGARRSFGRGSVLWLAGRSLCAVRCYGDEPSVLLVVSRRAGESGRTGSS
jgi:hypothetical protein